MLLRAGAYYPGKAAGWKASPWEEEQGKRLKQITKKEGLEEELIEV